MNTRKIIEGIHTRIFDPSYVSELKRAYEAEVATGSFQVEENEYSIGKKFLDETLPESKKSLLTELEENYNRKWHYAGTYPLYCGLACAFEQFFVRDRIQAFDYHHLIEKGMDTLPGMERHREYHSCTTKILTISEQLLEGADEATNFHITSVECGWDQRIHSASIVAFYVGYRYGLDIIDKLAPVASAELIDKTLLLEYELGFTTPYKFREQKLEEVAV